MSRDPEVLGPAVHRAEGNLVSRVSPRWWGGAGGPGPGT